MEIGDIVQVYTNTLNPFPSLASEKKCIREYIFVFATLYSRYESYSSLGVFVPAHYRLPRVAHVSRDASSISEKDDSRSHPKRGFFKEQDN